MKVKTLVTLYRDYDSDYVDMDSPKMDYPWYKLNEHYEVMRRGSVLTVYTRKQYFEDETERDGIILTGKGPFYLILDSIDDVYKNKHWYQVIED